jgi:anaerobic C4-dicarboxylate transporter
MNNEIYILVGICVLTFIIGHKLKQKLNKPEPKKHTRRGEKTKNNKEISSSATSKKEKLKIAFLYTVLVLVFGLLIFMIPALSKDILSNNHVDYQNLILRILIVAFATYILFMGFLKLRRPPENNN